MAYLKCKFFRGIALLLIIATLIPLASPTVFSTGDNAPVIEKLPDVLAAQVGKKVSVTVDAKATSGAELSYQWYFAEKGTNKYYKSSITSDTYTVNMSQARDGRKIYCVVTDQNGYSAKSETVTLRVGAPLVIRKQPTNVSVAAGVSAITTVQASGQGQLKYQWYIRDAGSLKFTRSSIVSNSYNITMTPSVSKRQVYCVITDELGQTITTNTVVLTMNNDLAIYQQPEDGYIKNGQIGSVSVSANGLGELNYQWFVRKAGGKKFYESSVTGPVYRAKMTKDVDGREVYCVITDKEGHKVTSKTATLHLLDSITITQQPTDVKVADSGNATVTIQAAGEGKLHYKWYFAQPGSDKFYESSITTSTYSVKMTSARNGRRVYCVVSDDHGQSVTSDIVTLTIPDSLYITSQPTDGIAKDGATAKVSVAVNGEGALQYQWYIRNPGGKKFYKSSVTTSFYSAKMSDNTDGREVYCVITDQYGQKVTSDTVTIRRPAPLSITVQPEGDKALTGDKIETIIQVTGEGELQYQWYIRNAGGKQFHKASSTSPKYSTIMSDSVDGREAYCVITDKYGQKVKTDVVTFSRPIALEITQQPEDVKIISGKVFTISVDVSGEEGLQYQWYVRNVGRKKFYPSAAKGSTYSAKMSDSVDGREVYCVITDKYGQKVQTETVTLQENHDGLHILIVGNSHSLDAFWFLRSAWMDQFPDADLCVGILYYSGGSISEHVTAANNFDPVNRYYLNNDGKWVIEHNVTHEYILTDQEWDIILMQPGKEDIVHPTLNKTGRYQLTEVIDRYVKNPHKFMWHITWPCPNDETFFSPDYVRQPPEGYKDRLIALYGFNPVNQYSEKIEMTKKHILDDPLYDDALCSGAAIMHAHLTQGVTQLELYRDYTHLNDYGRLMVAYALVAQFTKNPIEHVGIDVIDVRSRYHMFKDQGDLYITDQMKEYIINAANYSLETPWEMPEQTKK